MTDSLVYVTSEIETARVYRGGQCGPEVMPSGLVQILYMAPRAACLVGQVGEWSEDNLMELAMTIHDRGIAYLYGDSQYWASIGGAVELHEGAGIGMMQIHLTDLFLEPGHELG